MRLNALLAGLLATAVTTATAIASQSGIEVVPVQRSQIGLSVSVAGTVTARKTVQLAAQTPGRVITIAGREGDTFSSGAVLIQLDEAAMLARREAAMAARESALASIQNAQAQYRREIYSPRSDAASSAPGGMGMPAMMDDMFSSPMQGFMGMRDDEIQRYSDMVGARTQVAQAQTALRQAEASIMEIDASLRDTRSIAPFDGIIEKVYVEVGDTVQPGQPIVDFSETGRYKVEADLPVHLVRNLSKGQSLPVSLDNKGRSISAEVYRIHPVADARRHTVRVEFSLPTSVNATAGQYAEIRVPDTSNQLPAQLTMPMSAVLSRGGMAQVFAVDQTGAARLRVVRLGEATGDGRVVVLSGVLEGNLVVNNPPPGLRSGVVVMPTMDPSNQPMPAGGPRPGIPANSQSVAH